MPRKYQKITREQESQVREWFLARAALGNQKQFAARIGVALERVQAICSKVRGKTPMIKRDELRGPSCLTNAADDEPLFVLRANDEIAAGLVYVWAAKYCASKGGRSKMTVKQLQKLDEAYALYDAMIEWKKAHP